jgi:chromosome segregation ATPase
MTEETTRNLPDKYPFEERMFARFDAMETRFDRRFDALDTRVQALEAKALDTKPIWERALAEIVEVKQGVEEVKEHVANIERKFDVLTLDMMQLRGDQRRVEKRMDALES